MKCFAISFLMSFAACTMYKSNFDCPSGVGVGCKSSTEVMEMVVERQKDEDLFIRDLDAAETIRAWENRHGS